MISRSLAFLAASLLGGCASTPSKDLDPAATQARLDSRTLSDPALHRFLAAHGQPVVPEWDLARLTLAAFHFSPELEVARARLAEAAAAAQTAKALPNPMFTFTPGYNQDAPGGVTPWILGYALNVPLELAGKRSHRSATAAHQMEAARFDLAQVAWQTRSAVRRTLADAHAAEAAAAIWRETVPLLTRAAQLVAAQVQAGEIAPIEATRAEVARQRAELAFRENERAVVIARSRIAEAIGIPPPELEKVRLSFRDLAVPAGPVDVAGARRWAAQNRADLLSALATYAARQSALQAELRRNYADLALGPGYELDQGDGKWSLALGVTLPLFHRNQGPIAEAQARRETAAAEFLALQNRVLAGVDRAVADHAHALRELESVAAIRAHLERAAQVTLASQAAGESSRLDLVRTQIELADHARVEIATHHRAEVAVGALEDAVQRPLAWPEAAWNPARTASK